MASYDPAFRIDTDAYEQARRVRTVRTTAYWLILILAACGAAAVFAVLAGRILHPGTPGVAAEHVKLAPPPPVAQTRIAIWNVRAQAAATARVTGALKAAGYPIAATRNVPKARLHGTWIMFAPGAESAAIGVARKLGLKSGRVSPLDGVAPSAIAPASVLVLITR